MLWSGKSCSGKFLFDFCCSTNLLFITWIPVWQGVNFALISYYLVYVIIATERQEHYLFLDWFLLRGIVLVWFCSFSSRLMYINCFIDRLIDKAVFVFCLHCRNGGCTNVHRSMFSEHLNLIVHYDMWSHIARFRSVNKINHQRKLNIHLRRRYLVTSIQVTLF